MLPLRWTIFEPRGYLTCRMPHFDELQVYLIETTSVITVSWMLQLMQHISVQRNTFICLYACGDCRAAPQCKLMPHGRVSAAPT